MKKDDIQPDKPKKKPQKKAAKQPVSKKQPKQDEPQDAKTVEITLPVKPTEPTPALIFKERRLNLDAKKYRSGLTLGELLSMTMTNTLKTIRLAKSS